MAENNKPEWFEIADNDGPTKPLEATKTLPIAAVFAAALILGIGAIVSQVQQESPASANETTAGQVIEATSSPASSGTSSVSPTPTDTPGLTNPAIAQLPTQGDDEFDHDDDQGRSGRGHHEDHDEEGDDD
jgi:type IV secretory pathway VirB10-like protein